MIQLNLLPDLKKEYLRAQRTKALVISGSILVTIASVGITVLIALYALLGQQVQLLLVNNDIKDKSNSLNGFTDLDKYLTIQSQLAALPQLENSKGIYSRLLDFLPTLNPSSPNNVSLQTLNLSSAQSNQQLITLSGTTTTYQALNVFIDTLNNAQVTYQTANSSNTATDKVFESVSVVNSALGNVSGKQLVSFTLQVQYNPAVFSSQSTNVKVSVPNINTTPSANGSPSAVFGQGGK